LVGVERTGRSGAPEYFHLRSRNLSTSDGATITARNIACETAILRRRIFTCMRYRHQHLSNQNS